LLLTETMQIHHWWSGQQWFPGRGRPESSTLSAPGHQVRVLPRKLDTRCDLSKVESACECSGGSLDTLFEYRGRTD
jgi:hypothetical protein